jgi:tetratricopeptide (TPR) repeat protein
MLALLALFIAFAFAQPEDANDLFQKQDWAGAARLYETAVKSNPADGASWFRLGTCLHRLDRNQEAREAFHKALDLKFQPLAAMVAIARSHFKGGDSAEGLKWLKQAVDAGFANLSLLDNDPDLARAKAIPEVAKLRDRIATNANPCIGQPEYHQYDFWVGEWDVTSAGAPGPVHSRIERLLDGCIIQENWMPPGVPGGKSWNFYNAATRKWEQVWVAPGGSFKLEGTFHDGAMRFEGKVPRAGAPDRMDKLTFTPLEGGRVRQYWEQSLDGGKTWTVSFDGTYTPRKTQ